MRNGPRSKASTKASPNGQKNGTTTLTTNPPAPSGVETSPLYRSGRSSGERTSDRTRRRSGLISGKQILIQGSEGVKTGDRPIMMQWNPLIIGKSRGIAKVK